MGPHRNLTTFAGEYINAHCLRLLSGSDPGGGDFVNAEMWVNTDNSDTISINYWVEEGESFGWPEGNYSNIYWFWADQRPNSRYYEHDYLSLSTNLGTSYWTSISYAGNNSWLVSRSGSNLGYSTSNPPYSLVLTTGVEDTIPNSSRANMYTGTMKWIDATGGWHTTWPSVFTIQDNPPNGSWISYGNQFNGWDNLSAC